MRFRPSGRWWGVFWCSSESGCRWASSVAGRAAPPPGKPRPTPEAQAERKGRGEGAMRVEQVRGSLVEAWHAVHVAVVDSTGRLVARSGDPDLVTYWRS